VARQKRRVNNVVVYRQQLGLTQGQVADLCRPKLSGKTVARLESGKSRLQKTTYHRVLNALNDERKRRGEPSLTIDELYPHGID
jgi:predicted transcriptional regulator